MEEAINPNHSHPTTLACCIFLRKHIEIFVFHDDVIKWYIFRATGPFVRGIHRSPMISPQRPVTPSFDVFFDLRRIKSLSKQSKRRWFETPSRTLRRHCNVASFLNTQTSYIIEIRPLPRKEDNIRIAQSKYHSCWSHGNRKIPQNRLEMRSII